MNGYIKNKTPFWRHAMKRSVAPGQKIPLDELFEQYGKKYEIEPGKPFVDWLSSVKLSNMPGMWELVYKEDDPSSEVVATIEKEVPDFSEPITDQAESVVAETPVEEKAAPEKPKRKPRQKALQSEMSTGQEVRPFVKKPLEVKDIVQMSVRDARAELKKITDLNLLKYALQEARQLAGKDSLTILLRRRVQELELTRR